MPMIDKLKDLLNKLNKDVPPNSMANKQVANWRERVEVLENFVTNYENYKQTIKVQKYEYDAVQRPLQIDKTPSIKIEALDKVDGAEQARLYGQRKNAQPVMVIAANAEHIGGSLYRSNRPGDAQEEKAGNIYAGAVALASAPDVASAVDAQGHIHYSKPYKDLLSYRGALVVKNVPGLNDIRCDQVLVAAPNLKEGECSFNQEFMPHVYAAQVYTMYRNLFAALADMDPSQPIILTLPGTGVFLSDDPIIKEKAEKIQGLCLRQVLNENPSLAGREFYLPYGKDSRVLNIAMAETLDPALNTEKNILQRGLLWKKNESSVLNALRAIIEDIEFNADGDSIEAIDEEMKESLDELDEVKTDEDYKSLRHTLEVMGSWPVIEDLIREKRKVIENQAELAKKNILPQPVVVKQKKAKSVAAPQLTEAQLALISQQLPKPQQMTVNGRVQQRLADAGGNDLTFTIEQNGAITVSNSHGQIPFTDSFANYLNSEVADDRFGLISVMKDKDDTIISFTCADEVIFKAVMDQNQNKQICKNNANIVQFQAQQSQPQQTATNAKIQGQLAAVGGSDLIVTIENREVTIANSNGSSFTQSFETYLDNQIDPVNGFLTVKRAQDGRIISFTCMDEGIFNMVMNDQQNKQICENNANTVQLQAQQSAANAGFFNNLMSRLSAITQFVFNAIAAPFVALRNLFSRSQGTPNQDQGGRERSVKEVIDSGDAAVKTLEGFDFIRDALAHPESLAARGPNPNAREVNKKAPKLKITKDGKEKWVETPADKISSKTDIKSTSFTLLNKQGSGHLFASCMPGIVPSDLNLQNFAVGLIIDATKSRPAQHAYFKDDGFTARKIWREGKQPLTPDQKEKFLTEFRTNRISTYEGLKKFVAEGGSKGGHNELYTHTSKDAVKGVAIRSEEMYNHNIENVKLGIRVRAIVEKMKLEQALNKKLPIMVLNAKDNKPAFEYSLDEQKKDIITYCKNIANDPSLGITDVFGASPKDLNEYFGTNVKLTK